MNSPIPQYLNPLFFDSGLVELRIKQNGRWTPLWFDDPDRLLAAAHAHQEVDLFTSLNAPKLRSLNGPQSQLKNDDVAFITRLPFDFDPERPTGTNSTADELKDAEARVVGVRLRLYKSGWPLPAVGMSGNGYHLQYRCRLPNTSETAEMLRAIYTGLKSEFDDDVVRFDTSVRNPGRIFRLYGFKNRKGPDTPDRPQRVASVMVPPDWRQVTRRQVENLASSFVKAAVHADPLARSGQFVSGTGDYSTLDVVAWFKSHGLYGSHIADNMHDVVCPWEDEHSETNPNDTIIFEADGSWPGFHCKHSHCIDRRIQDVMELWGDADSFCTEHWGFK